MQLAGRPAGEAELLALAAQLEAARPWAERRPDAGGRGVRSHSARRPTLTAAAEHLFIAVVRQERSGVRGRQPAQLVDLVVRLEARILDSTAISQ